jgi:hypothetical protein
MRSNWKGILTAGSLVGVGLVAGLYAMQALWSRAG